MAKCPVCKEFINGYEWTVTKTGKKWLKSMNGQWHDCPKSTSKYTGKSKEKWFLLKAEDYIYCDMCGNWLLSPSTKEKHPDLHYISMDEHIKLQHPNNEILDRVDFIVPMLREVNDVRETEEQAKDRIRKEWKMEKRNNVYVLKGKFSS